jgi:polyhydroxyalkanoate synthesis regulator phasin
MGLGDLVQKVVYLGLGAASLAGEKASVTLADLKIQAQKLANELVERGEMTSEEARRFVDDMVAKAQSEQSTVTTNSSNQEPRQIQIDDESDSTQSSPASDVEEMRRRVAELQDELRRLRAD